MAEQKQKSSGRDNPPSNASQAARTAANKKRNDMKRADKAIADLDKRGRFTPHGTTRAKRRDAARSAWGEQEVGAKARPLSAFCT